MVQPEQIPVTQGTGIKAPGRNTTFGLVYETSGIFLRKAEFALCSALPSGLLSWTFLMIWLPKIASSDATGHENDNIRPEQHKVSDSCCFTLHAPLTPPGTVRRILCEGTYLQLFEPGQMFYMALHDLWSTECTKWTADIGCFMALLLRGGTSTFYCRNTALSANDPGIMKVEIHVVMVWVSDSGDKLKRAIIAGVLLSPRALTAFLSAVIPRQVTGATTSIISEVLSSLMGQEQAWAKDAAACVGAFLLNSLSTGPKWCNWKTKQKNPSWKKWMEASQD